MSSPHIKILISDPVDPQGVDLLKAQTSFEVVQGKQVNGELSQFQAWLVRSETKITPAELARAKNLKLIGRAGTGVDNIDVEEATKRGILVINVPGANAISVAEHAMALMLSLARKLVAADRAVKSGAWRDKSLLGSELYGKTLGLLGFGRVGREVARRASAFQMKIIARDPFLTENQAADAGVQLVSLEELLAQADMISLHAALTEKTYHLINAKAFEQMKRGVILINTSRGEIVDEKALLEAVKSDKVSFCALDVYSQEPPKGSPLLSLGDRVVLTPHVGASTQESQKRVAVELARSVIDYFDRGLVRGGVNLPAGFEPDILERLANHIRLAERLGRFAGQLLTGAWTQAELTTLKNFTEKEQKVLLHGALRGITSCALGGKVNMVNAGVFARERGLASTTAYFESAPQTAEEMNLNLALSNGERASLSGRVDAGGTLSITRIGNLLVDVTPEGTLIVLDNRDKPGIIGKVGTLLGKEGVNIADMRVGRKKKGADAIMVLTVDKKITPQVLQALTRLEGITRASLVLL